MNPGHLLKGDSLKHALVLGSTAALFVPWLADPAVAAEETKEPQRTRVGLGVQLVPSFPGSDRVSPRPLADVAKTRGDRPFEFEAPDESIGFPILRAGRFAFGPALGFEGSRTAKDVGASLPKVGFTVELGGFVQYAISDNIRARVEVRQGLGGHEGMIATGGIDYVAREKDRWLFSIGPRITFADHKYNDAYFSVAPNSATVTGLSAFTAGAGIQSVGGVTGYSQQLSRRWGVFGYGKYDRLVGDPARSPIVRGLGSRGQFSAGIGLSYTLGRLN
jgi:outer membrane scaffolding protein for murein synthesis (MipA/OmpV family)